MLLANFLFLSSALFYLLAFKYPILGLFFILNSFILFFYFVLFNRISFAQAFCWSIIAYSAHAYAVFYAISFIFNLSVSFCLTSFLLLYLVFLSSYWFFIISKIAFNNRFNIFIWILALASYYSFLYYGIFWIFDNFEGFVCLYPLVPLANLDWFCYILSFTGKELLLVLLLTIAAFIAVYRPSCKASRYIKLSLLLVILLVLSVQNKNNKPKNIKNITFAKLKFDPAKPEYIWDRVNAIAKEIAKNINKNINIKFIIFPESAFPYELNKYPKAIRLWSSILKDRVYLIIGSHRSSSKNQGIYNSLYLINNTGVVDYYDKCHRVFFAERAPKHLGLILKFLYKFDDYFLCGKKKNKIWKINKLNICPIVCSEFFFLNKIIKNKKLYNNLYLVVVNDLWFKDTFLPRILCLFAKFISYERNIKVIYSSYLYKHFF